jgi:lipoprotein-releasing system permease protein
MYKLHLILKYLRKRRIAWVSLIAVLLCTTMVLVVISVMGGWLRMFRESFKGLSGDVIVSSRSMAGFGHYEEMIKQIEALPEVHAAVPVIRSFGLINISNVIRDGVQVMGLPLDRIGLVNQFPQSLHRQYQLPVEQGRAPPVPSFDLVEDVPYELIRPTDRQALNRPGMIVGGGIVGIRKNEHGEVERPDGLYQAWARLETLAIQDDMVTLEGATPTPNIYWIVDDSRTQIWQYDSNTVYVPFDVLQADLGMGPRTYTDVETGQEVTEPSRTSEIQIKLVPGANLNATRDKVEAIVFAIAGTDNTASPLGARLKVQTWEDANALWLGAVEKETALVTFLFGIISLVAVFLIFCIFYMIVVEKTRDIGIIKSVGATSEGVAGIFLGYGAAIGIVGSLCGLLVGWLIVTYINEIHTAMGQVMGIQIWDPQVYAFDTIPNTVSPRAAIIIVSVAIVASIIGALVPAIRAAKMHPVEALRFE